MSRTKRYDFSEVKITNVPRPWTAAIEANKKYKEKIEKKRRQSLTSTKTA